MRCMFRFDIEDPTIDGKMSERGVLHLLFGCLSLLLCFLTAMMIIEFSFTSAPFFLISCVITIALAVLGISLIHGFYSREKAYIDAISRDIQEQVHDVVKADRGKDKEENTKSDAEHQVEQKKLMEWISDICISRLGGSDCRPEVLFDDGKVYIARFDKGDNGKLTVEVFGGKIS